MKKQLLFIAFIFLGLTLNAQHRCGFDEIHDDLLAKDPQYKKDVEKLNADWMEYVTSKSQNASRLVVTGSDSIYEIPVVVHVFHTGQAIGHNYNKSDAAIQAWLDNTNAMYAGTAPGFVTTGTGGTVIPIRLVLAKRSPTCDSTTGIIRIDGSTISGYSSAGLKRYSGTGATEVSLKDISRWDPNNYYNIYIVTEIDDWDAYVPGSGVVGYAGFPTNSNYNYSTFLLSSRVNATDKTMAHEFGHSMGLYHTFASSSGSTSCSPDETDCAAEGDRVCDTEIHPLVYTCPSAAATNPCTGVTYLGTQYNVMAYSSCPNRFSPGQRERAIFSLKTYRNNLLNSLGAEYPDGAAPILAATTTCLPTSIATAGFDMGPTFVGFNTIAVASNGYAGDGERFYIDYSEEICQYSVAHTELVAGATYPLQFTIIGDNDQFVTAYIDYNNNGTFESEEEIYNSLSRLAEGSYTHNITIPSTATKNTPLRLRVIADFSTFSSACSDRGYGQTEDFTVTVVSPLSQDILAFDAQNNNCENLISWKMNEVNEVQFFEIEKSKDGIKFETIASVDVIAGQTSYAITDHNKENGMVMYRMLVQLQNGQKNYSKLAKVAMNCNNGFNVYPNPTTDKVQVQYFSNGKSQANIYIIDVTGKVAVYNQFEVVNGENEWSVSLKDLPAGAYILKVDAGSTAYQQVIIKK